MSSLPFFLYILQGRKRWGVVQSRLRYCCHYSV